MTQIIDFSRSAITSFSQSITIPVPLSPSSYTLTEFGLATVQGGSVLLNATIGVQTTLGNPNLLLTILRSGTPVFTLLATAPGESQYTPLSLSYVDLNFPSGYFAYTLTISQVNSSTLNSANLTGPVDFSGLSLV
ncbi:hypothetical protein [Paenibacillus silagei]|uniref:Exosporium leader peptide n=1 Tax=Paenibacillus silagei TaxID=1670801 RepID=A0ABS4NW71_9BACL|nr:hypothetical protein [Paenibacillus silagei]MBP2113532.1 hypothetical protein [Paenibacillus silagei]